jgi:oxygen-independent coproporphyrinogen III oxidase
MKDVNGVKAVKLQSELLAKYDVPVPRYTSYPTVPYWTDSPSTARWLEALRTAAGPAQASWSMYVHVPFCETLCTFCGCNNVITKDHGRESPYVRTVLDEFALYREQCPDLALRPLKQLHLGGGTPTFLGPEPLRRLCSNLLDGLFIAPGFEGSVEVDPRRTSAAQLEVLRELGFSRVSLGVQDFDPAVQRLVNRIQPLQETAELTRRAREMGFKSVNYDLIYGLPKQTLESFTRTVQLTVELRPDRIALYSFALVPWIKPAQRLFKDDDLPAGAEKRALYERAYEILTAAGYVEIGMDHFALNLEGLAEAHRSGRLHRNFMGYTDQRTDILLGLGVSAISEAPDCFHQNEKVLPIYERRVRAAEIPTLRGHVLSASDRRHREWILQFMTKSRVDLPAETAADAGEFLAEMINDGLVRLNGGELILTEAGRPFLRNACVALDERMRAAKPGTKVFSQAL